MQMGEIGSEEPLDDHISEHDEDQHHAEIIRLRAALEAPPKGEAPHQMQHMSDQLPYIVPIMQAILAGTYKPARSAHDDFMAGGSRRDALLRSRCAYGDLTQRQKHALERVLKAWVFGDEDFHYLASQRRSEWDTGSDDPFATVSPPQNDASLLSETKNGAKAPPPSSSPDDDSVTVVPHDTSKFRSRLHGCEDYESLSELERHEVRGTASPALKVSHTDPTASTAQVFSSPKHAISYCCGTEANVRRSRCKATKRKSAYTQRPSYLPRNRTWSCRFATFAGSTRAEGSRAWAATMYPLLHSPIREGRGGTP